MPSFRIPTLFRPSRSFRRLRSFHLSPAETAAQLEQAAPPPTTPIPSPLPLPQTNNGAQITPRALNIPLRGGSIAKLALVVSLVFIFTVTIAFIGGDVNDPYFELVLDEAANTSPGIVLIGESVDVDVDEPSITIRWSILACGESFILPGSAGVHGSKACGLPVQPLYIFVDNDQQPAATYDPSHIPFNKATGSRRSIQNVVQFDSDHVLDVHEARLYPFDTYLLTSTLRAVSFTNENLPIRRIVTIDVTSSFNIETSDMESYSTLTNGTQVISRDIDIKVKRPSIARLFTWLLFGVAWILTHATVGLVIIARKLRDVRSTLKHLVFAAAILVAIPQLRNSMPDAPGLDGVLIDSIGFFPQMIITAISVIILLVLLVGREIDAIRSRQNGVPPSHPTRLPSTVIPRPRPPPSPTANSTSMEIAQYDMYRLMKHLKGQYVFPPVQDSHHRRSLSYQTAHRKSKTMSKIVEGGEKSRWSDWVE